MSELKIGDKLYKYLTFNGIGTYTIIGVRDYGKNKQLYEVECEDCTDHDKCIVLIAKDDDRKYKYVDMINNDNSDDYDTIDQTYWHNDGFYFLSENECLVFLHEKLRKDKKDEIEKLEKNIEFKKKELSKLEIHLNTLNKALTNKP